jgi:hypothetical protein
MRSRTFLAAGIAATLVTCGAVLAACSSSSAPVTAGMTPPTYDMDSGIGPTPDAIALPCPNGALSITFSPMFSAFDGKHNFQVPAYATGTTSNVTWSADTSFVGMQSDSERPNEVLITMLKAGVTAITATSGDGKCGSAQLNISASTTTDWEIGNERYNNGTSLHLAAVGVASPDGGSPFEQGNGGPACTNCHGETATSSVFVDVSHTPEQTGGFSDDDLVNIILHGTFPTEGNAFDPTIVNETTWHEFHQWADITPDQEKGIITYLRSLPPAPQHGALNFGALGQGNDSGTSTVDAAPDGAGADSDVAGGSADATVE